MISLITKLNKLTQQIKKDPNKIDPMLLVEILYKVVAYLNKFRSLPIHLEPDLIQRVKDEGPAALISVLPVFYIDPDPVKDFLNRAGFDLVSSDEITHIMKLIESLTDKVKIIGG